jgi:hypothetical protein
LANLETKLEKCLIFVLQDKINAHRNKLESLKKYYETKNKTFDENLEIVSNLKKESKTKEDIIESRKSILQRLNKHQHLSLVCS